MACSRISVSGSFFLVLQSLNFHMGATCNYVCCARSRWFKALEEQCRWNSKMIVFLLACCLFIGVVFNLCLPLKNNGRKTHFIFCGPLHSAEDTATSEIKGSCTQNAPRSGSRPKLSLQFNKYGPTSPFHQTQWKTVCSLRISNIHCTASNR